MFSGPRVTLQVIEYGIQGKFTVVYWDQKPLQRQRVTFIERVAAKMDAKLILNLLGSHLLIAAEDIRSRTISEAKFMHKDHLSVGDEANMSICWDEAYALLEGVLELSKFLTGQRGIYQQQEDRLLGRGLRWQDILDRCEIRHQLCWQLLLGDVLRVVGRERTFLLTRGTSPSLEAEIDLTVRIQHGLAVLAGDWRILHQSHVLNLFHGRVHAANGHNDPGLADLVAGPEVPRKADAIFLLSLIEVHS